MSTFTLQIKEVPGKKVRISTKISGMVIQVMTQKRWPLKRVCIFFRVKLN